MALALVVTAVMARALGEFSASRAALSRSRSQYSLAGAHDLAGLTILQTGPAAPYRWRLTGELQGIIALAEPERAKLSISVAAKMPDSLMRAMSISDIPDLRRRLEVLAADPDATIVAVENADAAPLWKACVWSLVSPYGEAKKPVLSRPEEPEAGDVTGHAGELWRLRMTSAGGWSDDRLVRLTGDASHPAAVVERRFVKAGIRAARCDGVFEEAGAS